LLYAAQRCGERTARLFIMSAENGALVLGYGETTRNRALIGRKVLTLVEGHRAPHEAIFALVLAGLAPTQARRCVLRTPGIQGYPVDAYIFDLPAAESRKTAALDAPCGPYGRSARADSYWRMFDGVGVFYRFSGDRPEFDPGSLLVYRPRR
jgi:hypothetical protein